MRNTSKKSKAVKAPTLAVDYTPEQVAALAEARKAATAFKAWQGRGDGTILLQCVAATRHALESGLLVDGRAKDAQPGTYSKSKYAELFKVPKHTAPVTDVSFWMRLGTANAAGVEIGSPLWEALASAAQDTLGGTSRLAKNGEVGKVIDSGAGPDEIRKACEQVVAEADRKRTAGRKARPSAEKAAEAESIPTTDDPVRDALTAVIALQGALSRIPVEDTAGWAKVRKALAKATRETAKARAEAAAEPTPENLPVAI